MPFDRYSPREARYPLPLSSPAGLLECTGWAPGLAWRGSAWRGLACRPAAWPVDLRALWRRSGEVRVRPARQRLSRRAAGLGISSWRELLGSGGARSFDRSRGDGRNREEYIQTAAPRCARRKTITMTTNFRCRLRLCTAQRCPSGRSWSDLLQMGHWID